MSGRGRRTHFDKRRFACFADLEPHGIARAKRNRCPGRILDRDGLDECPVFVGDDYHDDTNANAGSCVPKLTLDNSAVSNAIADGSPVAVMVITCGFSAARLVDVVDSELDEERLELVLTSSKLLPDVRLVADVLVDAL